AKLQTLKYSGDISQYLLTFQSWNVHTKVTRVILRDFIKRGLLEQLRLVLISMPMVPLGDDETWIRQVEQAGKEYEDHKQTSARYGSGAENGNSQPTKK